MSERDNLLLRWARLKQAARAAKEIDGTLPGPDAMAAAETPFDPASLPSIESIAADTDIIAFLRAGVPAELTRAALRRAWTSDPAVRDFIGIAENQWDFNDPNAIPGFGPLAPTESGVDILDQISSRLERQAGTLGNSTAGEAAPSNVDAYELDRQLATSDPPLASLGAAPNAVQAIAEGEAEGENVPTARRTAKIRRHGSALPH
jgi:hypothetical protein